MTVTESLTVQMHQQDTNYYCGAACAQMVLETIGAGLLDQDDLYADNHSHGMQDLVDAWYTPPDGLQWTMMDRRPPGFTNTFALFALGTEEELSRKLCWTIHHYQVAPITLVFDWVHWIVVRGYTASAHPASSGDNGYAIDAFDIDNPWPATPQPGPPPPHGPADGCGTGADRGFANEHVTYATWQSTYMTGVKSGHWAGKFVAVCDPEPPARPGGALRPPSRRRGEGALLSPKELAKLAVAGLREYGLFERKDWLPLSKARPRPGKMVQRLDRQDSYYALVPFEIARGTVAFAAVDGLRGDYMQAALCSKPQPHGARLTPEQAFKRIAGQRIDLGGNRGRLLARSEALSMHPLPVWRPCLESLSLYYPFYMFTMGDQRLYVRIDGAVFSSLTLDIRGV